MLLGILLIFSALGLLLYNQHEADMAKEASMIMLEELNQEEPVEGNPLEGKTCIGQLQIPDLGLVLPVLEEWSYPNLKLAPCRYSGSLESRDLVIMAHNYKTHFGNLLSLQNGAPIYFEDLNHKRTTFSVAGFETLKPDQVEEMKAGNYPLTLFTCTYGGRTRIVLRCQEVMSE